VARPRKQPKIASRPGPVEKRPRRFPTTGHNSEQVAWRFGWIDRDEACRWSFESVAADKLAEIIKKLGDWEGKTWAQILTEDKKAQHDVALESLIPDAQAQLQKMKLDDFDALFRFRFSGKERLWGVRIDNIFYLLWWDPEHEVCPSTKRNT